MGETDQRRALLERALLVMAVLTYVVIVSSALLRLMQDGLGCPDWPACYAVPPTLAAETPVLERVMRVVHRIAAAGVGFAVILVAFLVFRGRGHARRKWFAAGLVALTVFLAVLGRATPGAVLPAVTLGNLLGGLLMLGLAWRLRLEVLGAARSASPALRLGLALIVLQIGLGASVSAFHAAASCASLPACHGEWLPGGVAAASLDPLRPPPALTGAALAGEPSRAALHMVHRLAALLVVSCWIALALLLRRARGARAAGLTAGLLIVQAALGAAAVGLAMPLALAVLHNAVAAMIVLAAVSAVYQSREAVAAPVSAACQMVISK